MIRVYVAGPYSADNVLDVLKNIGRGEKACAELFAKGYAPFCPWHDKSYVIDNPEADFKVSQFYAYSLAWLEVSDAVVLLPGWERSKGTIAEVDRAEQLGIPVYYSVAELLEAGEIPTRSASSYELAESERHRQILTQQNIELLQRTQQC